MAGSGPGTELAGYRLESLLGRGGMGVVYQQLQPRGSAAADAHGFVVTANRLFASPAIPQGGGLHTDFPVTLTRTVIAGNKPDQCFGC